MPDLLLADGEAVGFGGVTFRFTDVGPAESLNESLIEMPDYQAAFVGDLFYHRAHPWLVEGRTARWLEVLRDAKNRYENDKYKNDKTLLPGHGLPAGSFALAEQADYIENFVALVRGEAASEGVISEADQERIETTQNTKHPAWALVGLHRLNVAGVLAELTGEKR